MRRANNSFLGIASSTNGSLSSADFGDNVWPTSVRHARETDTVGTLYAMQQHRGELTREFPFFDYAVEASENAGVRCYEGEEDEI